MKLKLRHIMIMVTCLIQGCAQTTEKGNDILQNPFFGIEPSDTLQLVAPNIVSSNLAEYNGTFSPDGAEFYYTVSFPGRSVIAFTKLSPDNNWSTPAIASFSGQYSEFDPILSPDGNRLFFTSYRPINDSSRNRWPNIWYVDRVGDEWGSPEFISLTEDGDYYSSPTKSGNIYFNIWKTGDIYRAVKTDSTYSVEKISSIINSDKTEADPFISPDEDYLIFRGYNQEVSFGAGDLYISFNIDNQWTKPENLGDVINSSEDDICPLVTPDGKLFIFSSNRFREEFKPAAFESLEPYKQRFRTSDNGAFNIYAISAGFIEKLRKKHQ